MTRPSLPSAALEGTSRPSRNEFDALTREAHDCAIFTLDPHGRVSTWSIGAERIKGYAAAEILGAHFSRFYVPEDVAAGKPESRLARAAELGHIDDEGYRVRKDGSRFWASVLMTALRGAGGDLRGFAKVTRDVSERKRRDTWEHVLAGAGAILLEFLDHREALNRVVELVVPAAAEWCAAVVTVPHQEVVAVAHADPSSARTVRDLHEAFARDQAAWPAAAEVMRTGRAAQSCDGPEPSTVVALQARGRMLGTLSFSMKQRCTETDVTFAEELGRCAALAIDNSLLYAAAQVSLATRDEMQAMIYHDLRSPLTAAKLSAELASRRLAAGNNVTLRELQRVGCAVEHAQDLVRDLLNVASMQSGRFTVARGIVDASAVLAETIELHQPIASSRGIALEADFRLPGALVLGDRRRLLQVLANVIGNALKFTRAGRRVMLEARAVAQQVEIRVSDEGPGIPREELAHVFQARWSANRSDRNGTGLGLYIAKNIVEAHHGSIAVESSVGNGATFTVKLPLVPPSVPWDDGLAWGIPDIDDQHRMFHREVDQLLKSIAEGRNESEIESCLAFLATYVTAHFSAEEAVMMSRGYPELAWHRARHAEFIAGFSRFRAEHEAAPSDPQLLTRLAGLLMTWLHDHVATADRALADFIARERGRPTPGPRTRSSN